MKKIIATGIFALIIAITANCQEPKEINVKVKQPNGTEILSGEFDRSALAESQFAAWFDPAYSNYEVEKSKLGDLPKKLKNYTMEVYVGTWCGDSKRELPALYKILEEVKYPLEKMKVYGVDRQKKSYDSIEQGSNITHVPTIILYDKKGKEAGRIVESPASAYLEVDLDHIVKGTPLKPNYAK